jgi:type I restriction enzyme, S subunit
MSREVPEGWKDSTVAETCEILDSRRKPLNSEERSSKRGQFPYWGANGIVDYIDGWLFDEPLVLMAEDGGYFAEAGERPICHRLDGKAWVNNHAHVIRPTAVTRDWFYYWFVHRDITPHIKGGTRSKLNQKDLKQLPILVPTLHEQRRIAEVLSSVDDAIAATRAVIEQTKKVKQGVLERLLTKGIGHTRFKQTEIGEIPEGWEVHSLAELAQSGKNTFVIGPFGSDLTMKDYRDEGVPVVFVRDVQREKFFWKSNVYVSQEKAQSLKAHFALPGDIVITKMGLPPGLAAIIPPDFEKGVVTADIIRMRPNLNLVDPAFLAAALNGRNIGESVMEITGGQTRPKITLRDYKNIILAVPPIDEQQAIAGCLAPFARSIELVSAQLANLQELKSALMSDLLTGRKRVTHTLPLTPQEDAA